MKKTFDLLVNLKLDDLKNTSSPALQEFEFQLREDYNAYIKPLEFNPIIQADNWLSQVRLLAANKQAGIDNESMRKLDEISTLYGGMGETAFIILDMYHAIDTVSNEMANDTMGTVSDEMTTASVKAIINQYKEHLENKLRHEGIAIEHKRVNEPIDNTKSPLTSRQDKLLFRYSAISDLHAYLNEKTTLSTEDLQKITKKYNTCLQNKPNWSERPFLQKLTDFLSLGLKPLYRAFFSTESKLEEQWHDKFPNQGLKP